MNTEITMTMESLPRQVDETLDADAARRSRALFNALMIVGAATVVVGAAFGGARFWSALLLVSTFLVGLGLAGGALMAYEYLSGAGWSVAVRRVPEAMTALLYWGGLGILAVLLLRPSLYPWTSPEEHFIGFKGFWLNRPFFLVRAVAYLSIWIGLSRLMVANSRRGDEEGGLGRRRLNTVLSGVYIVTFALTVWLSTVDWIMTLEPHWYSTVFGVYNYAGIMSSGIAVAILLGLWLRRLGPWRGVLRDDHLQDWGKLLLTFCTFWIYIWFSQYMLIWYGNVPEETVYFIRRTSGAWGSLMLLNLALNWVVPFFLLLPRWTKRDGRVLGQIAVVVLAGRWLDLYIMIVPADPSASTVPTLWDAGLTVGAVGVVCWAFWRAMRRAAVAPVGDPYLPESLHYHS